MTADQPDGHLSAEDPTPSDGLRAEVAPERLAEALCGRAEPAEWEFDRFLPRPLARASGQFWTPLVVAVRAAEWFREHGIRTVVDIGSGVGKLCIAAALSGDCRFVGVEQRPRLVDVARDLARLFRVEDRVQFLSGVFGEDTLPVADAYYLYNPFGENLFGRGSHLDEDVELGGQRHAREVEATRRFLAGAPIGTFVVTYNGFGGALPESYTELDVDRELPNVLKISRKLDLRSSRR